jgi:hypothetical protein
MIASEDPAIPSGIRSDLPSELETAVLACLVKNADQRGTLVALARTLVRFAPERARPSLDRVESVLGAERSQKSMPVVAVKPPETARTQSSWGEEDKTRKRGGGSALTLLATVAVILVGIGVYTGKIDVHALAGQTTSATGAASAAPSAKGAKTSPGASSSATSTTITVPPIASIVAPIASVVEPIMSALAPAASSAPAAGSAPAPSASAQEDVDAGDDDETDDEEPAATAPSAPAAAGQPATPRPVVTPAHPSQPKHVQSRPRHPKRRHH